MSLHVPLSDLHGDHDFSPGLDPADLSALAPSYYLRCIYMYGAPVALLHAVLEDSEKLQPRGREDRGEHTDGFFMQAWLDGDMHRSVGLNVVLALDGVLRGQVDNQLRPPCRGHGPVGKLKREVPDKFLKLATLTLEGILPYT